jgi:hypothetical protein
MSFPDSYTSKVTMPVPSADAIRAVVGDSYDPVSALNVEKDARRNAGHVPWRLVLRKDLALAEPSPDSNRRAADLMQRFDVISSPS